MPVIPQYTSQVQVKPVQNPLINPDNSEGQAFENLGRAISGVGRDVFEYQKVLDREQEKQDTLTLHRYELELGATADRMLLSAKNAKGINATGDGKDIRPVYDTTTEAFDSFDDEIDYVPAHLEERAALIFNKAKAHLEKGVLEHVTSENNKMLTDTQIALQQQFTNRISSTMYVSDDETMRSVDDALKAYGEYAQQVGVPPEVLKSKQAELRSHNLVAAIKARVNNKMPGAAMELYQKAAQQGLLTAEDSDKIYHSIKPVAERQEAVTFADSVYSQADNYEDMFTAVREKYKDNVGMMEVAEARIHNRQARDKELEQAAVKEISSGLWGQIADHQTKRGGVPDVSDLDQDALMALTELDGKQAEEIVQFLAKAASNKKTNADYQEVLARLNDISTNGVGGKKGKKRFLPVLSDVSGMDAYKRLPSDIQRELIGQIQSATRQAEADNRARYHFSRGVAEDKKRDQQDKNFAALFTDPKRVKMMIEDYDTKKALATGSLSPQQVAVIEKMRADATSDDPKLLQNMSEQVKTTLHRNNVTEKDDPAKYNGAISYMTQYTYDYQRRNGGLPKPKELDDAVVSYLNGRVTTEGRLWGTREQGAWETDPAKVVVPDADKKRLRQMFITGGFSKPTDEMIKEAYIREKGVMKKAE